MRVSQTVKDYIRSKVSEKYSEKRADALSEYNEKREKMEDMLYALLDKTNKEAKEIAESMGYEPRYSTDTDIFAFRASLYCREEEGKKNALSEECRNKIQDIIVTLELGGSKEDLERMLSEIK